MIVRTIDLGRDLSRRPVWWSLDVGAVLIEDSPLGRRVRSATWGTGRTKKFGENMSDGEAPKETFLVRSALCALVARRARPAMMGLSE